VKTCERTTSRSQYEKSGITAQFGARHYVQLDQTMRQFFVRLHLGLLEIAGDHVTLPSSTSKDGWVEKTLPRHNIYNDQSKLAMPVVQMRFSRSFARDQRIRWSRGDLGRVKQALGDEVAMLGLGEDNRIVPTRIPIRFSRVLDEDITDPHDGSRKLVLVPHPEDEGVDLMAREADLIVNGIRSEFKTRTTGRLARHCEPRETAVLPSLTDEFSAMLTVGEIMPAVPEDKKQRCMNYLNNLLPLDAYLNPIVFTPELKR
jgi:hypothetical protein